MPDKKNNNEINYLPDIDDYLESIDDNLPIYINELEEIIENVAANSNLSKEQASIIVREYFQVIRNLMLRGHRVMLRGLGSFLISYKLNKKRIFPKFIPCSNLKKKLNE